MAVVSYVSDQDAAEKIKPVFEGMEKKLGVVPNVFRVMAHNPDMLEAFSGRSTPRLPKTKLNGKLRELAYIKTSRAERLRLLLAPSSRARQESRAERSAGCRDGAGRDQRRL